MRNLRQLGSGAPPAIVMNLGEGVSREAGAQITPWSNVPAAIEYSCFQQLGQVRGGVVQEQLRQCATWRREAIAGGERVLELMPWDAASWGAVLGGFRVRLERNVKLEPDPQAFREWAAFFDAHLAGGLLTAQRTDALGCATAVLLSATPRFCRLVLPRPPGADGRPASPAWGDFPWEEVAAWGCHVGVLRPLA